MAEMPSEYGSETQRYTFLCSGVLITGIILNRKKKHQEEGAFLEGQPLVEMLRVEGTLEEMREKNEKDLESLDRSPESNDMLLLGDAQVFTSTGTINVQSLNLRVAAIEAYW